MSFALFTDVPHASAQEESGGLSALAVAEKQRNYGRLTLTFRDRLDLPPYELNAENGVLRIVFEEPVDTDIADAMRTLADYVTIARRDPDGQALRFGLSRAVRINTMEAGETLFVDFLPTSWQGFPPPLPEEVVARLAERAEQAAREAAEAERRRLLGELEPEVNLRIGRAPTFTRYTFDWNVPFNVVVTQLGPKLRFEFDYDVPIDLAPARVDQAGELETIEFERDGASLTVEMNVVPGSQLRWFEDQQQFIVDLEREEPESDTVATRDEINQLLQQLAPQALTGGEDATRFGSVGQRNAATVEPEAAPQLSNTTDMLDPSDLVRVDAGQGEAMGSEAAGALQLDPERAEVPDMAGERAEAPESEAARAPEVAEQASAEVDPSLVLVDVRLDENSARLMFPFSQPTPAAAFRRDSFVTLVFENTTPLDLRSLRAELGDWIRSIQPIRVDGLYVLNLELRDTALVSMVPSGQRWIVQLGDAIVEPPMGLEVGRGTKPDGSAYAEIMGEDFGRVRRITHPHVGDDLFVVPMLGPPQGALSRQALVEFDLLPSAHGVVLRPKSDDLMVETQPDHILISRDEGLSLSEVGLSLGSFGFSAVERPGYIDLREELGDGPNGFEARYGGFQTALATSEGPARTERLLAFARFLLAFELGQEANGALDIAASLSPALEQDEGFLTMRAAALTLSERFGEAKSIVDSHAMEGVVDGGFWGLLSDAALRNWAQVNADYDEVAVLFDSYPAPLVARARLDGIEAALNVGAIDLASERLAHIDPSRLVQTPYAHRFELLEARIVLAKGRLEEAVAAFEAIQAKDPGPIGAQATLLAIETQIANELITPDEGLERLENLAVAWRGDDTEVNARTLLGDLYTGRGRHAEALAALKGILIAQPDHPEAADVSDQMQDIFVDLYLNGEADALPALDALSLFYDFRELTPIGRRGDELVRRLADRLVAIDLLGQAAELLEHQVEHRLTGTAKAQIAADLALIYLMDYRPSQAVAVLQRSRVSQVPMSIERGRRIIEARALSELGRHELALEMLREFEGHDVAAVRADVLWNAERWQDAGEVLERAMQDRWRDAVPLDEDEMQQVLRASIAFGFAQDEYSLNRLRARYDAKMSDGIYASAFDVVTAPIEAQGSAFRDVARSIAGLNTLSRFLADYRSEFSSRALQSGA